MSLRQRGRSLWVVDPSRSTIRFSVSLGQLAVVEGRCTRFSGLLVWDDRVGQPVAVGVEMDARSLETGQTQRDLHMHTGDFLDVETYPSIRFASRRMDVLRADRIRVTGSPCPPTSSRCRFWYEADVTGGRFVTAPYGPAWYCSPKTGWDPLGGAHDASPYRLNRGPES